MDLPWSLYDLGKFLLLNGAAVPAVSAYLRAVTASGSDGEAMASALESVEILREKSLIPLPAAGLVVRILRLALHVCGQSPIKSNNANESPGSRPIELG